MQRVYKAQSENPHKGDWVELVDKDLTMLELDKETLTKMEESMAKNVIKTKIEEVAFKTL